MIHSSSVSLEKVLRVISEERVLYMILLSTFIEINTFRDHRGRQKETVRLTTRPLSLIRRCSICII